MPKSRKYAPDTGDFLATIRSLATERFARGAILLAVLLFLISYAIEAKLPFASRLFLGFGMAVMWSPIMTRLYDLQKESTARRESQETVGLALSEAFGRLRAMKAVGLSTVYPELPFDEIRTAIESSRRVFLLNTWIPSYDKIANAVEIAAAKGAEVRILLIDPSCKAAAQRAADLKGMTTANLWSNVEVTFETLKVVVGQSLGEVDSGTAVWDINRQRSPDEQKQGVVDIRFYKCIPSLAVYGTDDGIYISAFFKHKLAHDGMCIRLPGSGIAGTDVRKHFAAVWRTSTKEFPFGRPRVVPPCGKLQHLYYLSEDKKGVYWRYLQVNVENLINSATSVTKRLAYSEGSALYAIGGEQDANNVVVRMMAVDGANDENVASFCYNGTPNVPTILVGVMSHVDFRGQPRLDPALLMDDEENRTLFSETDVNNVPKDCEKVADSSLSDKLMSKWSQSPEAGRLRGMP